MKNNIKQIIDELYAIDPELKKYEDRIVKIVEKFAESKPDTKFNEEFAKALKVRILSEPLPQKPARSLFSIFNMNKNYLAIPAFAVVAAVLVLVVQFNQKQTSKPSDVAVSRGVTVTKLAAGAFGTLSTGNNSAVQPSQKQLSATSPAFGRGGGGGGVASATVAASDSSGAAVSGEAVAPSAKMMIYRPYQIKYVFKGEKFELKDKSLDVFRRIKPSINTSAAAGTLNKLGFGGIDLGSFGGSEVTNFELSQPGSDGYVTNVNLRDGQISINLNYFAVEPCAKNGTCPQLEPLRPSQMPNDDQIISVANDFLKGHGISVASYGKPKVENDWRKAVESTAPGFAPYVPDVISVVYPNVMNGSEIYELGGSLNGMRVNVDVRKKKVVGVWGIVNQNYESSAYEAETDSSRIIKFAENGGIYNGGYAASDVEIVEVELGSPSRVYVNMWKSDGSGEVIVPALSFPVLNPPKGSQYYVQNSIIIPLIKEMLQVPEPGPIQIMKSNETVSSPEPAKGL